MGFLLCAAAAVSLVTAGFEDEANGRPAGWNAPEVYQVARGEGRNGTAALKFSCATNRVFTPAVVQDIRLEPGKSYRGSVWVKVEDVKIAQKGERTAAIAIEWANKEGKLRGAYSKKVILGTADWQRVDVLTPKIDEDVVNSHVQVYLGYGKTTGTAWFDEVVVEEDVHPPVEGLYVDVYRAVAAEGRVRFVAPVNCPTKDVAGYFAELAYCGSDGTVRTCVTTNGLARGVVEFGFRVDDLKMGQQDLSCSLKDAEGKTLGSAKCQFTRTAEVPRRRVEFDRLNRTIVDGEPFFPLGAYIKGNRGKELDAFADGPFNCFIDYREPTLEDMDEFQRRGLKVIFPLEELYAGRWFAKVLKLKNLEEEEAYVTKRVNAFKNHPALLSWYLNDEIDKSRIDELRRRQKLLERLDDQHPTWTVLYQVESIPAYFGSYDIIGSDPYPIGHGNRTELDMASDWTRLTRAGSYGIRPVWQVPQAFSWAWFKGKPDDPMPTEEQMRSMSWQMLANGANGLIYFGYHQVRLNGGERFDEYWKALKNVATEIRRFFPIFLAPDEPPVFVSDRKASEVPVRLFRNRDTVYLLAANSSKKGRRVRVSVAGSFVLNETLFGAKAGQGADGCVEVDLPGYGYSLLRMSGCRPVAQALSLDGARGLRSRFFTDPAKVPVSFKYDGRIYRGFAGCEVLENSIDSAFGGRLRVRIDETLEAVLEARFEGLYGESEYVVWFENHGSKKSKLLTDIRPMDGSFPGANPRLRGILGDHVNQYAAYDHDLAKGDKYFCNVSGRPTHETFPYFDLVHGDGGTLIALGWGGTWDALFAATDAGATMKAKTCVMFKAHLLPGERIRTGLVVLLPYRGRNQDNAMNLWRRWFVDCNMPRATAAGDRIKPFYTTTFAKDTGRPDSDGSAAEGHDTWKRTLDKLIAEKVIPDFRWFDAGWYSYPDGMTSGLDWRWSVGSWTVDQAKWPEMSLRDSNDACHAVGMKSYCWFEPERVTHVDDLVRLHGYRREWAFPDPNGSPNILNDLGDDACREWTFRRIVKVLDENRFDLYREDHNFKPEPGWWQKDSGETKRLGFPRKGMAETAGVLGHYRLWDDIITHCAARGKCTYIDSCASGGGRNDIESLRRGVPFLRSDSDRTSTSLRLSMTSSFCRWIPFHGAGTKETETEFEASKGIGGDVYVARASLLPFWHVKEAISHNKDLDWDLYRRNLSEWRSVNDLLTKDFYVLTPWHHNWTRTGWTAFAYDDPEKGETLLLAFRMEECKDAAFSAKLPFAEKGVRYEVRNEDTQEVLSLDGNKLNEGFEVFLKEPRSAALFRIHRQ